MREFYCFKCMVHVSITNLSTIFPTSMLTHYINFCFVDLQTSCNRVMFQPAWRRAPVAREQLASVYVHENVTPKVVFLADCQTDDYSPDVAHD